MQANSILDLLVATVVRRVTQPNQLQIVTIPVFYGYTKPSHTPRVCRITITSSAYNSYYRVSYTNSVTTDTQSKYDGLTI